MGSHLRNPTNQSNPNLPSTQRRDSAHANLRISPQYLLRSSGFVVRVGVDYVDVVSCIPSGEKRGGRKRVEDEGGDEIHGNN